MKPEQKKRSGKKQGARGKKSFNGSRARGNKPEFEKDQSQGIPDSAQPTKSGLIDDGKFFDWLNKYPQLSVAVGSIPFPNRPGMRITLDTAAGTYTSVPGVLCVDWIPSVGLSLDGGSPTSQVARELYARVRSAYSADLDADGQDMLILIQCLDSVSAYISWLKRVYRTINAWTPDNYLTPESLMHAYGLTDSTVVNIRQNISDFGRGINELILRFNSYVIPDVFDVFHRHRWMSEHVYKDCEDLYNAQLYVFNPMGFYCYDQVNTPQSKPAAGATMYALNFGDAATYSDILTFGTMMLEKLYAWSTSRTINGYFTRVFEGANRYLISELGYDEVQVPVYSETVLAQIENAHSAAVISTLGSNAAVTFTFTGMQISQDPLNDAILCNNSYTMATTGGITPTSSDKTNVRPHLNIRAISPTVADVLTASRLYSRTNGVAKGDGSITVAVRSGTEIVVKFRLIDLWAAQLVGIAANGFQFPSQINNVSTSGYLLGLLAAFDWHPFIEIPTTTAGYVIMAGDMHNMCAFGEEQLDDMNRVCLFSEYNAFGIV